MGKLDGKVCVVTGASRGIGASIAELFAAEGGKVICAARTLKEGDHPMPGSLEHTVSTIREAGGEATAVPVNLADYDDCVRLIAEAQRIYGPVDVLINNAALTYFVPIKDFPVKRWHRSLDVNFNAPFYLSQEVLQAMVERKAGAIVNISSAAAIGPGRGPYSGPGMGGGTLYGAEKAALERFTQGLAQEVYNDGISVTCLSPSQVVPTAGTLHHGMVKSLDDPAGEPPEVMARAALLLATEPKEKVAGRVTYSQEILLEFGQIDAGAGTGVDSPGSGYSQI